MSFSTFFSSAVAVSPMKVNWFGRQANSTAGASASTTSAASKEDRKEDMFSMLNSIGPLYSVPYLLFQKGYDCSEIASQLNVPVGTVKSRIFTARVKMKHLIAARNAV